MKRLAGKTAIVTGSGQGIGEDIARHFAREGAQVVLAERYLERAEAVQRKIEDEGGTAFAVRCDVGVKEDVEATVAATIEKFGTVDLLVNNAQALVLNIPLLDTDDEQVRLSIETGYYATFWFMKACFPHLKQNRGKVINFGSSAGSKALPLQAAYGANKEAIRSLSRTAAREWGKFGININVIVPMAVTPASDEFMGEELRNKMLRDVPLKRWGTTEDVARVAVFLASNESDYITGHTLWVDGGFSMDAAR